MAFLNVNFKDRFTRGVDGIYRQMSPVVFT